ncbi:Nn.00g025940.m01.CDS01 [Neocucurbitaria sp. VM-36]
MASASVSVDLIGNDGPEQDCIPDQRLSQQNHPEDEQKRRSYMFHSNPPAGGISTGRVESAQSDTGQGEMSDTDDGDEGFALPLNWPEFHKPTTCTLFASIPTPILTALLDGSLAYKVLGEQDPQISPYFQRDPTPEDSDQHAWYMQSTASDAPAIYVRLFTNDGGQAPSPVQYMTVCTALRRYADGDEDEVRKLDNVWKPRSTAGGPYYLQGKVSHARQVFTWCQAIDLMCQVVPEKKWDQPHPVPRSYCGYAKTVSHRDRQYAKRQSCTWIVTLVEAAFEYYYPECKSAFRTFTICFMAAEVEMGLAERALTRCTNSILRYGGFCVAAPGQCSSAKTANWAFLEHWRYQNTPIVANTNAEARRLDEPFYQSDTARHVAYLQQENKRDERDEELAAQRVELNEKRKKIKETLTHP